MSTLAKFCLMLSCIFGLSKICASQPFSFFLPREDGSVLEGYFLPPKDFSSPIVFAIQGSSCESSLQWHVDLSKQLEFLGLGLIVLEKQGISQNGINLFEYNRSNCLENRFADYLSCLQNLQAISPEWEGKIIFLGESEGGMLASKLARQLPETAAVLLFATGGGLNPKEETKWVIRHRLEKLGEPEDQIDVYMAFLDAQMELMTLDPSPNKQFLGNTYKWWASLLAEDEALISLSQLTIPIYLVHGVQDDKIPVLSADLVSELLQTTNTLTYLRLEGYGHDLNHAGVHAATNLWLQSILSGQDPSDVIQITSEHSSAPVFFEDWEIDLSEYVLNRGTVSAGASVSRDTEGNQKASVGVSVIKDLDNGSNVQGKASGSATQDREGNTKGEASVEVSWNCPW